MEIKPTKLEQVFIDSYLDEAWFAHHEGLENGEDYDIYVRRRFWSSILLIIK